MRMIAAATTTFVPMCTPKTCAELNYNCGESGDGCDDGVILQCGTCGTNMACGANGPNQCGPVCVPLTCAEAGAQCGDIGDGCGNVIDCGPCTGGLACGGGGTANQCGGIF